MVLTDIHLSYQIPNLHLGTLLAIYIIYQVILTIYNLTLHPLSKFPGPKLAGATRFYQAYHALWKLPSTGGLYFHLERLHADYGPVVRIAPNRVSHSCFL